MDMETRSESCLYEYDDGGLCVTNPAWRWGAGWFGVKQYIHQAELSEMGLERSAILPTALGNLRGRLGGNSWIPALSSL